MNHHVVRVCPNRSKDHLSRRDLPVTIDNPNLYLVLTKGCGNDSRARNACAGPLQLRWPCDLLPREFKGGIAIAGGCVEFRCLVDPDDGIANGRRHTSNSGYNDRCQQRRRCKARCRRSDRQTVGLFFRRVLKCPCRQVSLLSQNWGRCSDRHEAGVPFSPSYIEAAVWATDLLLPCHIARTLCRLPLVIDVVPGRRRVPDLDGELRG